LITASLLAPLLNAQELKQFTVDSLVAKNIEAKGGIEALRAVQSLQLKGKMLVNQGQIELTYTQTKKRPEQIRTEATLQGMTMVQAYDGTEGWKISPFGGRKDPEKMSADDAKSLIEDAESIGKQKEAPSNISVPKMWMALLPINSKLSGRTATLVMSTLIPIISSKSGS